MAQTGTNRPVAASDLPAVDGKGKIPALDEPAPAPDLSGIPQQESPSIPRLRPPQKETDQAKDQDWAAQAMLQKKEDAKKKEQEQAALAEQKVRESQQALEKEKKEKQEEMARAAKQPAVAKPAADGFGETDVQKLPVVTGMDGVKPRALDSGLPAATNPAPASPASAPSGWWPMPS